MVSNFKAFLNCTVMNKKFYITSAIPYVNAAPHIGHALEFVQADAIARYHALLDEDVLYLTGSDENALKNVQAAEKAGKPVQEFVNENADRFEELLKKLNVRVDIFQRGSDQKTHFMSSQKLWDLCNHDIYQKEYTGLYCVGFVTFYERVELDVNVECFEHPGKKLEEVSEMNYFFKLSTYQDQLRKLISSDELKIVPETRKNEMLSFLKQPLQDISISRSDERAKNWGVPVPGDDSQRMYVWFDALNIYQSGIGFGADEEKYNTWWPADVHVIGKGITRFHAIYWPAFLISAKLPLPKELFVHGYITVDGQKMSKSIGNVVDPFEMIEKYGVDALRYYLLREIPSHGDGDFSERRFKELYNADLANGLGNLVARVAKLAEKANVSLSHSREGGNLKRSPIGVGDDIEQYHLLFKEYKLNEVLEFVWKTISGLDKKINESKPWELEGEALKKSIKPLAESMYELGYLLTPFLPQTAEKILKQFSGNIQSSTPLFPRLQ
ncbi:MAG: methionine--tRNA ligase [Candidatus Roizmanbacteria bacterium]|nr:methionine--tRNA ligase [Candidatus Roizmanbacteria bacterium]